MSDPSTSGGESREVVPVELFFDLVFVFALSQLSQHLLVTLSWHGAAQTAVLLCAVFGVWAYTSFQATVLGPERKGVQAALLAVMFPVLIMNASIGDAFTDGGWVFVAPLLACQFGYGTLTLRTAPVAGLREHFGRMLVWFTGTAPLWLVGAAVAPGPRLAWWGAAAAVDLAGTWLAHPVPGRVLRSDRWPFDAAHMVERLRLFLIIALGEAVVTTGTAIAASPTHLSTVLAGLGGLAAVVALWAVYFGGANPLVRAHLDRTGDPIRSARLSLNGGYVVLAGLIALAVGNELVIGHPGQAGSWRLGVLLFGGPLLYLIAQNWYLARTSAQTFRWLWITYAALFIGAIVARALPAWASLILLLTILGGTVAGILRAADDPKAPAAHD